MLRKCQDEVAGLQAKRAQLENDRRQIGSVIGELDEKKRAALKDTWQKVRGCCGGVWGVVWGGVGGGLCCVFFDACTGFRGARCACCTTPHYNLNPPHNNPLNK